ncbi:D-sedoheptulose-7-phosphate isomerase [Knoellia sp. Soil729]|uniref:D-sedoheptulose-7-phosphate isomerase n=1 Tax=Knoellia sp. Soil729 TaxID=1736394 RepID=UPI0006F1DFC6|nr:SIS domain-containing protein [Knoellia sp. Soil729]KRE41623.1 phosphoheptose isomerase [Knoellia sp. Soil729]
MTTSPDSAFVDELHSQARKSWSEIVARLGEPDLVQAVDAAGREIFAALAQGHQLLILGNGGSAAMASHVAAEFAGKCVLDREPLPAISLAESSTVITAVGNDFGFDQVFVRGVRAHGRRGDVLLAMSTSGSSPNVLAALEAARARHITTILLTGESGTDAHLADHVLRAPSSYTPRIQEIHLMWSHSWCEAVDSAWAAQS